MTTKKSLQNEITEMVCVINHFKKGNDVVINRWVNQFNYTYQMICDETNILIKEYNKKYGKKFGQLNTIY